MEILERKNAITKIKKKMIRQDQKQNGDDKGKSQGT